VVVSGVHFDMPIVVAGGRSWGAKLSKVSPKFYDTKYCNYLYGFRHQSHGETSL